MATIKIPPVIRHADLLDPAVVAIEVTTVKGELALLSSRLTTGLDNVSSSLAALQTEFREHGRLLKSVETSQHDLQQHSQGLERVGNALERHIVESFDYRKTHESANQRVADQVNRFSGIVAGFGLLGAVVVTVAILWINAEFGNIRREASDQTARNSDARASIVRQHEQDITRLEARLTLMEAAKVAK